jgi:hypothetical protein
MRRCKRKISGLWHNLWVILGQFRVFASFCPDGFSDVTGAPLGGGGASPLRVFPVFRGYQF